MNLQKKAELYLLLMEKKQEPWMYFGSSSLAHYSTNLVDN